MEAHPSRPSSEVLDGLSESVTVASARARALLGWVAVADGERVGPSGPISGGDQRRPKPQPHQCTITPLETLDVLPCGGGQKVWELSRYQVWYQRSVPPWIGSPTAAERALIDGSPPPG